MCPRWLPLNKWFNDIDKSNRHYQSKEESEIKCRRKLKDEWKSMKKKKFIPLGFAWISLVSRKATTLDRDTRARGRRCGLLRFINHRKITDTDKYCVDRVHHVSHRPPIVPQSNGFFFPPFWCTIYKLIFLKKFEVCFRFLRRRIFSFFLFFTAKDFMVLY